jgi:acyl-CoA reductase-like NAD-dependent aldehyde dehydrogenase
MKGGPEALISTTLYTGMRSTFESGLGREGGHEGIAEYTEVKSVVVNLG